MGGCFASLPHAGKGDFRKIEAIERTRNQVGAATHYKDD